ncbi:MAG: rRNA (cytidine1920-2-O)/16S rRNA (cytidine1409-2-O)-methyltransferase [Methanolobus sp.]|jgi:23S rRNA (cytidine1920-2'-O)/16S rRNA (cytidine1409-2'-O)-methyltransferase|uniref:SAM-dependent methyltransferase n=1 Tax=Methanolobus sp. TaxID=1874737 RepID=UPI0024AC7D07|nr:SAM-dependent methyltransferase [Methanolobus sp.]MDI3486139.1 rRNA (cytidine1920-2-O)/16S rRNA (cytidine1409-2-O)-methyltransferase [Methanolobus sp.]MDK2831001.1 rRNA (cytidine1920-2-O)/16S rRNA (cytidine1409-2-O)-methyltransferase [Methanolobus sp.]
MRLDAYLVETGLFKSRGRAKTAILNGSVRVDGTVIKKPSKDISADSEIDVDEGLDMSRGYFKLKRIQDATGVISQGDRVLDLGSSAGGFLMMASEIASSVKGVEFSRDFDDELEKVVNDKENVTVMFGDVFQIPLNEMSPEQVDVILSDMTLEPMDSLAALERVLPLLRDNGKLLQVIKIGKEKNSKPILAKVESLGVKILDVLESERQEIYIIAQKTAHNARE